MYDLSNIFLFQRKGMTRVRTGMRRPSWNKSQAIQQVISLKALLEPSDDDSGAGALRRAVVSLPRVSLTRSYPPSSPPPFGSREIPRKIVVLLWPKCSLSFYNKELRFSTTKQRFLFYSLTM